MKIKFLMVLNLAAFLMLTGCGSCGSGNTNNANVNVNKTNATPVNKTNESASVDPNLKSKIESALKAKGFSDVTVDTSTTPMTISGSCPKGKLAEVNSIAMENNGGKPVNNKVIEK